MTVSTPNLPSASTFDSLVANTDLGGGVMATRRVLKADALTQLFNSSTGQKILGFTCEQFGADPTGAAYSTQAFKDLGDAASAAGSGIINFFPGGTYKVWTDGEVAELDYLIKLVGTNGITINFNGAKIITPATSFAGEALVIWANGGVAANRNLVINDPWFEQTAFRNCSPGFDFTHGSILINLVDAFENVVVNNPRQIGGIGCIFAGRNGTVKAGRGVTVTNGYIEGVFYPAAGNGNLDGLTWKGARFKNVGRAVFPDGCDDWDMSYVEEVVVNILPSISVDVYGDGTLTDALNTTSNIKIRAKLLPGATMPDGLGYAGIKFQVNPSPARGIVRNIDIWLDATALGVGTISSAMQVLKLDVAGAHDTACRGHVLENVTFGGLFNYDGGLVNTFQAFNVGGEKWYASGTASTVTPQTCSFTGSVAGNTLTVSAMTSGVVYAGTSIGGAALLGGVKVIQQLSGTPGGIGTYRVSISRTAASGTLNGTYGLLTLGGTLSGTAAIGCLLKGDLVVPNTMITDSDGAGHWIVDNNTAVASSLIYASEVVRNVTIRNLIVTGTHQGQGLKSIDVDLTGLEGPFNIEDVKVDVPGSIVGYDATNLAVSNFQYVGTEWPGIWNTTGPDVSASLSGSIEVNGSVDVSQELGTTGATLATTTPRWIADCWAAKYINTAAVATAAQLAAASFPSARKGCSFGLQLKATTALSSLANGDCALVRTFVEGYRAAGLDWGSSFAKPLTYAFEMYSAEEGVAFVKVSNADYSRCYYDEISVVIGWNRFNRTIAGCTDGTWNASTGVGLWFEVFAAGKAATPVAPGAWSTTNTTQTTNSSTNLLSVNNDQVIVTKLKLFPGFAVLPTLSLGRRAFPDERLRSMRYWRKSWEYATAVGTATTTGAQDLTVPSVGTGSMFRTVNFDPPMIVVPTLTVYDVAGASGTVTKGANGKTALTQWATAHSASIGTSDATSARELSFHYTADARPALT